MLSLSVNRWGFTDKLFEMNNLSGRRRVFTDKITFCETTIIRNSRSAHKINAVCYEEWDNSELDRVEQPACLDYWGRLSEKSNIPQ